jgi:hypothetical protein
METPFFDTEWLYNWLAVRAEQFFEYKHKSTTTGITYLPIADRGCRIGIHYFILMPQLDKFIWRRI